MNIFGGNRNSNSQPEDKDKDKNMTGLLPVFGCNNSNRKCDVIFVHGLAGHSWGSWHPRSNKDGKDLNFWLYWLGEDLQTEGLDVGVWTFGYEAARFQFSGAAISRFDLGSNLLEYLKVKNIGKRPLIFVTHSMGGLVVKEAIRTALDFDDKKAIIKLTKGIVFLSTPHTGSHLANLIDNIRFFTRPNINVGELKAHSSELRKLNQWYRQNVENLTIQTKVFYETQGINGILVVDSDSANPGIKDVPLAEPWLNQCLSTTKERLGEEHSNVVFSLNNLAFLYELQGRYEQAEPLLIQVLDSRRKLLTEKNPNVATSLNNLAELYRLQGRYKQAEPLYLQALDLRKELLGEKHPDVATSLNNLVLLYSSQGRYKQAEPLLLQALDLRKELLGEKHPYVANSLNNLAALYFSQGRYKQAEPLLLQALDLMKEVLGEKHPDVATNLNNLAELYRLQGRYSEAEPLYLQALDLMKEVLGEKHPLVAQGLYNSAALYFSQGQYEQAEPLLLQALELMKEVLGEKHPLVAQGLIDLAGFYSLQGRYEDAVPLFFQALEIAEQKLGVNHPNTVTIRKNLKYLRDNS